MSIDPSLLVDRDQAARVAARRREVQADEARRKPATPSGAAGAVGIVSGRCRYCRDAFTYQAPVMRFPTGQVVPIGGPRVVCHAEACATVDRERREGEAAEAARAAADDAARARHDAYVQWVDPIYHVDARIAPAATAHLIPELQAWHADQSVYLHGPSSSGKTHQVACLMHRVAGRVSMEWYSTRHLLRDAQASFGSKGRTPMPGILDDPTRCRVLVLDDVFAEATSAWAATTVGNMIDARYRMGLPVVFTSNVAIDEIVGTAEGSRHNIATVRLELKRIAERVLEMTTAPHGIRHELDARNWRHALAAGEATP